jgi:hypothetical protein
MNRVVQLKTSRRIVLGLLLSTLYASAVEEKPLPAFSVTSSAGVPVASTALTEAHQYVLLYLVPGCRPCESLLASLNDPESPQLSRRVVIVVRGDSTRAAKYIHDHVPPEAVDVKWYADVNDSAYRALQFTGTPDLLGVRDGRLMWSITGVLNDSTMVRAVMRKWTMY